jgi:two-component system probable response regulator PhcQ
MTNNPPQVMDFPCDYKRFAILYVDDEQLSLKAFTREFRDTFRIFTASSADEGLKILEAHADEIGVVMSDQRMPGMKGVQFLERARQLRPRGIRILVTAFSDLDAAISAVNTGAIYKYVTKPWDNPTLGVLLRRSLDFFVVQRERDQLLREKMSVLHKMVITDRVLSLGVLAAGLGNHVRNAMSAVRTFIDLAPEMLHRESLDLSQLRHPSFWQEFHRTVQGRVKILIDLLDDLSDHAQRNPFAFEDEVPLRQTVQKAIDDASAELGAKSITVDNHISELLPPIRADLPKLRKLFRLLLHDELGNLPAGATISFDAVIHEATPNQGAEIELIMKDNGPGVPHEAILSVFDPFFTRNSVPNEFGVYLMACYFIVYHHGGRMTTQDAPGGGVKFQIFLPLVPPTSSQGEDGEDFLVRVMTNERLWEKLLASS